MKKYGSKKYGWNKFFVLPASVASSAVSAEG